MDSDKTTRRNFINLAALLGVGLYTANAAAEASCGGKCFDIARINRTRKPEKLKFGHKFVNGAQIKTQEDSSPANIRRVCENSLLKLGVEALGFFYRHRIDPKTPMETVAETLAQFIKEGKVLGFGLFEVNADTIRRARAVCPLAAVQSE